MFTLFKLLDANERQLKKYFHIADEIEALEPEISSLTDDALKEKTVEFKERYTEDNESLDELLPEAYAVVREAAKRTLNMRHFRVQLVGGMVLHHGNIAEMKTGEGKTLVATLPAYLNALTGKGVHIITVNDYLVERDREWMGKIFEFLGLTVGLNLPHLSPEEKKVAYEADITFGTNNEFGFDYLRDNMVLFPEQLTQRELNYAIIDEVDSILIDEARTPLIISGEASKATDLYTTADQVVKRLIAEEDYSVDIKTKQVSLTEEGVQRVETLLGVENLYDVKNISLNHHLQQALKAYTLMKKDQDYVVNEDGIVIVDEYTGRLMYGRRYSDGLHQAIEAKEGLPIQRESMTLATITLQNYFRLYNKISGMTGTAKTEEEELRKIYNMDVLQVPTNQPIRRHDLSDVLYRTEEGKFRAVVDEIELRHKQGQPILVGTVSIDKSEKLSRMLAQKNIIHQVLNAKNHAKEAEIIADAGKKGVVTIATNMAGRGTDIVLGDEVADLGGLHVVGTERHESRRIDNQLRGRSGRQGDLGSSQFFLSFSDDLMRRFGGDNLDSMCERLGLDEDQPIEGKMFTRVVANAQKKVEGINFDTRRWVLQYDDVLNQQRGIFYKQRREVLTSSDLKEIVLEMAKETIKKAVNMHTSDELEEEWTLGALIEYADTNLLPEGSVKEEEIEESPPQEIVSILQKRLEEAYVVRTEEFGYKEFQDFCKVVILRTVDRKWMDHIDAMEQLRQGIHLRAYGQDNPLRAYQFEGFAMFEALVQEIQEEVVKYAMKAVFVQEDEMEPQLSSQEMVTSSGKEESGTKKSKTQPVRRKEKIGRNAPCPCGSDLKYKNCCLKKY